MEQLFGECSSSALLGLLPPSWALPKLFTVGQSEKLPRPLPCAQQELQHPCVTNTVLVTNLNHSTIPAAVKTIHFIPARPGTVPY